MKRTLSALLLSFFAVSGLSPGKAYADDAAILARLAALEQEIAVLKRQLEVKKEEDDKKKPDTPIVTASSKDGFQIKSPDDAFKLKIGGYAQAEGKFFIDNKKDIGTTDTFQDRNVRLILQGTVYNNYDFVISPEFGGSSPTLTDAYLDARLLPEFKIRAGKFKEPFGLERLQSTPVMTFAELGLPSNLTPNRDVGVQASGDLFGDTVSYAVGAFNGVEDNGTSITDSNQDKDVAARVFVTPFRNTDIAPLRGLGAGVAATFGHKEGSTGSLPSYRSPGQASIFSYNSSVTADGPHTRFSPQLYYAWNALGVLAEYVVSDEEAVRTASGSILRERFENDAWQVAVSYVLTGEDASYKGVVPRHPFSWKDGTWGAFEIGGRYGELDVDDSIFDLGYASLNTSVTLTESWGVVFNWYLNRNVRLLLEYDRTDFTGGGIGIDRATENAIWTRFQIAF